MDTRSSENLVVRSVPISSEQEKALESLEQAMFSLSADFQRDCGTGEEELMAGGLYRLWSTLNAITTLWKEQAADTGAVEQRTRALEVISAHEPNGSFEQAYLELKLIARGALD